MSERVSRMTDAGYRVGRPPRADMPSTNRIAFCVTADEFATIRERAAERGMTVSDFMRSIALSDDNA